MKTLPLLVLALAVVPAAHAESREKLKAELAQTERAFCALAARSGIAEAFLANMAPECFLPERLGLTRAEFAARVAASRARSGQKEGPNPAFQLTWEPLQVDVSADGTLGYTWGRYEATERAPDGKTTATPGIFVTIWKRQPDGSWKFVYDGAPQIPSDSGELRKFLSRSDLPHQP